MNPLTAILRGEIASSGPIPFRRFMEAALYHPLHGYYRRARDPFGKEGDYFTAEQLQPVFGILIASAIRRWRAELGDPADFTVVELGAGRREMAPAFAQFRYVPVDFSTGALPEHFSGVVFANEFFDALPIDLLVWRNGALREMQVGCNDDRLVWLEGPPPGQDAAGYAGRYGPPPEEGTLVEINLEALRWIERIATSLDRGYLVAIDYGYTTRELIRFPRGTLLSYRRHQASEDILADPGERDITAHVPFSALTGHAAAHGFETPRLETLAQTLMKAGEPDQFAEALAGASDQERLRRRMQLKTLLFGMGETFRALTARRAGKKNGPENSGP